MAQCRSSVWLRVISWEQLSLSFCFSRTGFNWLRIRQSLERLATIYIYIYIYMCVCVFCVMHQQYVCTSYISLKKTCSHASTTNLTTNIWATKLLQNYSLQTMIWPVIYLFYYNICICIWTKIYFLVCVREISLICAFSSCKWCMAYCILYITLVLLFYVCIYTLYIL